MEPRVWVAFLVLLTLTLVSRGIPQAQTCYEYDRESIELGELECHETVVSLDVDGVLGCVACEDSTLSFIDVADPTNPVFRGELRLDAEINEISIHCPFVYAACMDSGLYVVSLSDPEVPCVVQRYLVGRSVRELAAGDSILVAGDLDGKVTIFETLDDMGLEPVAEVALGEAGDARLMSVFGDLVAVVSNVVYYEGSSHYLSVLDLSSGPPFQLSSRLWISGGVTGLACSADTLTAGLTTAYQCDDGFGGYYYRYSIGASLYDVSDPMNPVLLDSNTDMTTICSSYYRIVPLEGCVWCIGGEETLQVVDLSAVEYLRYLNAYDCDVQPEDGSYAFQDDILFCMKPARSGNFVSLDLSDAQSSAVVGYVDGLVSEDCFIAHPFGGTMRGIAGLVGLPGGNVLYQETADDTYGGGKSASHAVGSTGTPVWSGICMNVVDVTSADERRIIGSRSGISQDAIYDWHTGEPIYTADGKGWIPSGELVDGILIHFSLSQGATAYDFREPTEEQEIVWSIGEDILPWPPDSQFVYKDYLYIVNDSEAPEVQFVIFKLNGDIAPTLVNEISFEHIDMWDDWGIYDGFVTSCTDRYGAEYVNKIIDMSDPELPVYLGQTDSVYYGPDTVVAGGTAYRLVYSYPSSQSIRSYDISDILHPEYSGCLVHPRGITGFAVANGFLVVTDDANTGMTTYRPDCGGFVALEDDTPPAAPTDINLLLHPPTPNPFNPLTNIRFVIPEPGPVELGVYDLRGRHVRTLINTSMSVGPHETIWDGRDADGAAMPSGVYFARLEFGGRVMSRKLGLVR